MTGAGTAKVAPWRSLLFVPVLQERFLVAAQTRGADALILDLEDAIPADRKAEARAALPAAVARLCGGPSDLLVRINRPWRDAVADLEAAVRPGVDALVIPKVADAAHLRHLDEVIAALEEERGLPAGGMGLIAMIETPQAFLEAAAIAAGPRVVAVTLGTEDFAAFTGSRPVASVMLVPSQMVAIAAAAAGVAALGFGGSIADYSDLEEMRRLARQAAGDFGFQGAFCIHPAQVAVVNDAYTPAPDAVAQARRVVAAAEASARAGRGAVALDGRMIDAPVVMRAQRLIGRMEAIERRFPPRGTDSPTNS
jgi:citrate lyase subunit beta/citryl-CoA lyase